MSNDLPEDNVPEKNDLPEEMVEHDVEELTDSDFNFMEEEAVSDVAAEPAEENDKDDTDSTQGNRKDDFTYEPQSNVTMEKPLTGYVEVSKDTNVPLCFLPCDRLKLSNQLAKANLDTNIEDATISDWLETIQYGETLTFRAAEFNDAVKDPESDWQQSVLDSRQKRLTIGKLSISSIGDNKSLTSNKAVAKINAKLGIGTTIKIPLWNSGLWIVINAPSNTALYNLQRQIFDEKNYLGRLTGGMAYGNTTVYYVKYMMDFLRDHLQSVNLPDEDIDQLGNLILVSDIQAIALGFGISMYPNGYNYVRPCVAKPTDCTHIAEGIVNLNLLYWTNRAALTEEQIEHMANPAKRVTAKEVLAYQSKGRSTKVKNITIDGDMIVNLKTPSVNKNIAAGYRWLEDIDSNIRSKFGSELDEEVMRARMADLMKLNQLRTYIHYIDSITFKDDDTFINSEEAIEKSVQAMAASEDTVIAVLDGVREYIDESQVSLTAIPKYNCPVCQSPAGPEYAKHPDLVVFDAVRTFFTLVDLRLRKAIEN